jgi:site-specific DNA-methyltransferase (adenine-specific)
MKLYYKDEYCTLLQGDCLEGMQKMIDKGLKFDAIITDPPYGTTSCKWDAVIPFDKMWKCLVSLRRNTNSSIILFGRQPFFSSLVCSNEKLFRYEIIWDKNAGTDFAQANNKPITVHENIAIFNEGKIKYNRIDDEGFEPYSDKRTQKKNSELGANGLLTRIPFENKTTRTPTTIRKYFPDNRKGLGSSLHPTQKPLALMEWLIKSYTDEGDVILDFTCGSGTTLLGAKNLNRVCYGIEKEEVYCEVTKNRLLKTQ